MGGAADLGMEAKALRVDTALLGGGGSLCGAGLRGNAAGGNSGIACPIFKVYSEEHDRPKDGHPTGANRTEA